MPVASVDALAREMFDAAAEMLGTLADRPVGTGDVTTGENPSSLRIDPAQVGIVTEVPAAGVVFVARFERDAFAHVVELMLGSAAGAGEMDAMHLSIVSETLAQISTAMAERIAAGLGVPVNGIASTVAQDAGAFPAPPFHTYSAEMRIGERSTLVEIDFDGIALAKLQPKPQPPQSERAVGRRAPPASEGQPVAFPTLAPTPIRSAPPGQANLDLVHDVPLEISAILGQTALSLRDVVALQAGSVFELNKLSTDPIDLYVNNILIARGEVVVVDDKFAVKISELNPNSDKP